MSETVKKISKLTLADVEEARGLLAKYLEPTPLHFNPWLSERLKCEVFLKLENMHPIGSFKIRGATYRMSKLTAQQRKKGVVAASAGNHAQGVAWGSAAFNVKATIVMPKTAPLMKVQNTKALGAKVILEGDSYEAAYQHARKIASKTGATYVPAYEDPYVIAGQGTTALEVLEQLPQVDCVIGSMGGGGLMTGMGIVFKAIRPKTVLIGAQASGAQSLAKSIKTHHLAHTERAETFADGIRVKNASPVIIKSLTRVLDYVATADDEAIAAAVLMLMEKAKTVAEGSGALPLAILEQMVQNSKKTIGKSLNLTGKKVVLVISGGNIDVNLLARIIDRGLIRSGRRLRLNVFIQDTPGYLNQLTSLIASYGANVLQVIHDRDIAKAGLNETAVELTLETRGPEHSRELIEQIRKLVIRMEES